MQNATVEREIYPDAGSLAQAAALRVAELAEQAIASSGRFSLALAGGATPRGAYRALALPEVSGRVDWPRVHVFWGDERCVGPDHPDSNYGMARETLLDQVPVPPGNIHRIHGETDPDRAAREYEATLHGYIGRGGRTETGAPAAGLDVILLGMGPEGHTASLFPGTDALRERQRWVVANHIGRLGAWRITFTPVFINRAAQVIFIVSGQAKADALRFVLAGPYDPDQFPAQVVHPASGRVLWLLDRAATARILPG